MPKEITDRSSNSERVHKLIEVLKREASLFEAFLELLERQQQALVQNDVAAINETTELQRERVIEAGILAKKREAIVQELANDYDARQDITISHLIESVASGPGELLSSLRDTILDLNDRITKVRSQNEMLIDHSREIIMKTMELLARIKMPDDSYHSEGKHNRAQTSLALDRRA